MRGTDRGTLSGISTIQLHNLEGIGARAERVQYELLLVPGRRGHQKELAEVLGMSPAVGTLWLG
jgi:hypothetical protein